MRPGALTGRQIPTTVRCPASGQAEAKGGGGACLTGINGLEQDFGNISVAKRPQLHTEATSEAAWTPNTDVYLTDGRLVIEVELGGDEAGNLERGVEGNRLRNLRFPAGRVSGGPVQVCADGITYGPGVIDLPPGWPEQRQGA